MSESATTTPKANLKAKLARRRQEAAEREMKRQGSGITIASMDSDGGVEMGTLAVTASADSIRDEDGTGRKKSAARRKVDDMLETLFVDYAEDNVMHEFSEENGKIHLERLLVALSFLLSEARFREQLEKESKKDQPDVPFDGEGSGFFGSLSAALSTTQVTPGNPDSEYGDTPVSHGNNVGVLADHGEKKLEILGDENSAKMPSFESLIGGRFDVRELVKSSFGKAEVKRYRQMWEDCRFDKAPPILTYFESACYTTLGQYLSLRCKRKSDLVLRVVHIIRELQALEAKPSSFHRGGFLYRVDNMLAVMLFRRKRRGKAANVKAEGNTVEQEAKQEAKEQRDEKMQYWDNLDTLCCNKTSSMAATLFFVTCSLIILASLIIWATWVNSTQTNMDAGMLALQGENEGRALRLAEDVFGQAITVENLARGEFDIFASDPDALINNANFGSGPSNDPDGTLDAFLSAMVTRFNVKTVGIGTTDGHFIAADRNTVDGSVHILAVSVNSTGPTSCLKRYLIDPATKARDESTVEDIVCGFDVTNEVWYTSAFGSSVGTWSSLYELFQGVNVEGPTGDDTTFSKLGLARSFQIKSFSGAARGVFFAHASSAIVSDVLKQVDVYKSGVVIVASDSLDIIASTADHFIIDDVEYVASSRSSLVSEAQNYLVNKYSDGSTLVSAIESKSEKFISVPHSGNTLYMTAMAEDESELPFTGWTIIVSVPESDYLAIIDDNWLATMTLAGGALAAALFLVFFSTRLVVRKEVDEEVQREADIAVRKHSRSQSTLSRKMSMHSKSATFHVKGHSMRLMGDGQTLINISAMERAKNFVIFFTFLILTLVLCIWLLWNRTTTPEVEAVTDVMKTEATQRVVELVQSLTKTPLIVLETFIDSFTRGTFVTNGGTYDRIFYHTMVAFATSVQIEGRPLLNRMSFGVEETGEVHGIQVYNFTKDGDGGLNYGVAYNVSGLYDELAVRFEGLDDGRYHSFASKPSALGDDKPALIRDETREITSGCCTFDLSAEKWYISGMNIAIENATSSAWGAPFKSDVTGSLVVSVSRPLYNSTSGSLIGVFSVDLDLDVLSEFLTEVQESSKKGGEEGTQTQTFILRRSGELIASSTIIDRVTLKSEGAFTGALSEDAQVGLTAKFLSGINGGLDGLTTTRSIRRPLDDPLTSVAMLDDCCQQNDFVVVVDLPFKSFFGEFDRRLLLSFLLCAGTFVMLMYMVVVAVVSFKTKYVNKDEFRDLEIEHQKILAQLGGQDVNKTQLVQLMRDIRPAVIEATAHNWRRVIAEKEEVFTTTTFSEVREHYCKEAMKHIRHSRKGRNVLTLCGLESRGLDLNRPYNPDDDARTPLRLYKIMTSFGYRMFINLVILTHIMMFFGEPDTYNDLKDNGPVVGTLVIEAVCLTVEFIDIFLNYKLAYEYKTRNKLDPSGSFYVDCTYLCLVVLIAIDFLITIGFSVSFEYLFPLRPLLIVIRNTSVRNAAINFIITLYHARNVFILYVSIVLTAAAMGTILFRSALNTTGPQSSFNNFVRAITTSFVYISTGENYTDLVYPTYEESEWYILYFIVFTVVGLFFVLAMVIGMFQDGFKQQRIKQQREEQLFNRVGTVAAFILMDLDGTEVLSANEFDDFLQTLNKDLSEDQRRALFHSANQDDSDAFIDIQEFVNGIEDIIWHRTIVDNKMFNTSKTKLFLRKMVVEAEWFNKLILLTVGGQIWILSLYGTFKNEKLLDITGSLIVIFFAIEMALRVWVYGFDEFWNYARHNGPKDTVESEEMKNQMETIRAKRELEQISEEKEELEERQRSKYGFVRSQSIQTTTKKHKPRADTIAEESQEVDFNAEYVEADDLDFELATKNAANEENINQMYAHRFDLFIVTLSFAAFVISRLYVSNLWFESNQDSVRFVVTFPALRIFSTIKRTRTLVFTLLTLLPQIGTVMAVMLVVLFLYGVLGVWFFHDEYEVLQEDAPAGQFNSLSDSLLTLFQLLVGEGWHDVMYASIRAKRGFGVGWYFVTFIIIVSLLFVNVFIGIILDAFMSLFRRNRMLRVQRKKERLRRLVRDRENKKSIGGASLDETQSVDGLEYEDTSSRT